MKFFAPIALFGSCLGAPTNVVSDFKCAVVANKSCCADITECKSTTVTTPLLWKTCIAKLPTNCTATATLTFGFAHNENMCTSTSGRLVINTALDGALTYASAALSLTDVTLPDSAKCQATQGIIDSVTVGSCLPGAVTSPKPFDLTAAPENMEVVVLPTSSKPTILITATAKTPARATCDFDVSGGNSQIIYALTAGTTAATTTPTVSGPTTIATKTVPADSASSRIAFGVAALVSAFAYLF